MGFEGQLPSLWDAVLEASTVLLAGVDEAAEPPQATILNAIVAAKSILTSFFILLFLPKILICVDFQTVCCVYVREKSFSSSDEICGRNLFAASADLFR